MKNGIILILLICTLSSCQRVVRDTNHLHNPKAQNSQCVKYELAQLANKNPQQIIEHTGYTISYNPVWKIPNWVAYSLTKSETMGTVPRDKNFYPDPAIKKDPITREDYNGVGKIGMSRGHMAPAGDMKWSETAMKESCYMTNICPQSSNLNNGDWKSLEEHARNWAIKYREVFIACGPIVEDDYLTIGRGIAIPNYFYKVILRRKENSWTAIGFVFANEAGSKPLMTHMFSVDEVEELTGIDFFYHLPDSIENKIEAEYIVSDWTL